MLKMKVFVLLLPFILVACNGDGSNDSRVSLSSITGELSSGRIREGIKITGDHFDENVVVSLLTMTGSKIADLLVTSVLAQEIEAKLPGNTTPGEYVVQLTKGLATVSQTISILRGEQGEKGDTGDTGAQGVKGDTGDAGPQGVQGDPGADGADGDTGSQGEQGIQGEPGTPAVGSLHLLDADTNDAGVVLDLDNSRFAISAKVWLSELGRYAWIDLETGLVVNTENLFYAAMDCVGDPFIESDGGIPYWHQARTGSGDLIQITSTTESSFTAQSVKWESDGSCTNGGWAYDFLPIEIVTLTNYPFSTPMTLEVQ